MRYSDAQMVIASQIAYIDWDMYLIDAGSCTVREFLELHSDDLDQGMRDDCRGLLEKIDTWPGCQECGDWVIKDIRNQQHTSGMYACLIDTGGRSALIAFRGSESDTLENIAKDWAVSDFGLLNSVLTPQQATAEQYMDYIYKTYGEQYGSFGVTGHSLGGNLAEHAVITAQDAMRDKVSQCMNLDGPGYSNSYMIAHENDIRKSQGLIEHRQWSLVGNLMNVVPGTDFQTVDAGTPEKSNLVESMAWRHDTSNVRFDQNGSMISAGKDWLAQLTGPLSQMIDLSIFARSGIIGAFLAAQYNNLDKIKDVFQNLWNQWTNVRFSGGGDVHFAMDVAAVSYDFAQMEEMVPRVREIAAEIDQVQKSLAFDSIAAGYIKLKLWNTIGNLEHDVDKLSVYVEKGGECAQCYRKYEQEIAGQYC